MYKNCEICFLYHYCVEYYLLKYRYCWNCMVKQLNLLYLNNLIFLDNQNFNMISQHHRSLLQKKQTKLLLPTLGHGIPNLTNVPYLIKFSLSMHTNDAITFLHLS